ncbi:hypothetical protein TIFTF001_011974 [Ficus carica]|uniref:Uncharacterized protein n=1 Tax=Ficus carica TaxID=3494 RepID=A0AA87ZSP4_FICCA|nr:hypothetical protein TIFTF001_011974 [Ficus carica]
MASATTPNTVEWSDEFLPVAPPPIACKMKHLGMMGTPVWCLPWALRCLSVLPGFGCSGQPGRAGYLGLLTGGDRRVVAAGACKGADPVRVGGGGWRRDTSQR